MELVLKTPKNKPPFIGICFDAETIYKGEKLHAEIVEQYRHCDYTIVFEHTPSALNMRLICEEQAMVYFYNHLSFSPEKLKSWQYLTKAAGKFSFGHIHKLFNKHELLLSHPSRKKFYVFVSKVSFIMAEDLDKDWDLPFTQSYGKW